MSNSYNTNPGNTTRIGVSSDYSTWAGGYSAVGGSIANGKGSGGSATGLNGGIGTQWIDGNYYAAGGGEGAGAGVDKIRRGGPAGGGGGEGGDIKADFSFRPQWVWAKWVSPWRLLRKLLY